MTRAVAPKRSVGALHKSEDIKDIKPFRDQGNREILCWEFDKIDNTQTDILVPDEK